MSQVTVLIADDSLTTRKWLVDLIGDESGLAVIGEVADGKAAVDFVAERSPDVVIMDMAMPILDGIQATTQIMAQHPTPIVVLSAASNRPSNLQVVDIVRAGALDVVEKPTRDDDRAAWIAKFILLLKAAAKTKVFARRERKAKATSILPASKVCGKGMDIIAIGASTGGPRTVAAIISRLEPRNVPVLLVNHFPQSLVTHFVQWLDDLLSMPVVIATESMRLDTLAGKVVVAAPDKHLVVRRSEVRSETGAPRHSCTPSVDVLFESVAQSIGQRAVGVLLTGVGADGAEGLLKMRRAGAVTIAQDEATSIVFGMPAAAIALGAATHVLADHQIASSLNRLFYQQVMDSA